MYNKAWYEKNREKQIEWNKGYQAKITLIIRWNKHYAPCTDCGNKYPYWVMQYDHLRDKSFVLAHGGRRTGLHKVLEEMDKCEIVCANCHATRTHNRLR